MAARTKASRTPRRKAQSERQQDRRRVDTWRPEIAFAAANAADEVASKLISVLVLLDHVIAPAPHVPVDDGAYVLYAARDIVDRCQRDLRNVVTDHGPAVEGGAR
jgi:hypothetical protein